jgi:hypothetical protein
MPNGSVALAPPWPVTFGWSYSVRSLAQRVPPGHWDDEQSARTRRSVGWARRVLTQRGQTAYIRPWQRRQTIMFLPFKRISDHFPGAGRSAATAAPWESSLEPADINLELQRSLPVRMRWSVF